MKKKAELKKIFDQAKGNPYYSFECFTNDARNFIKAIRKRAIVSSIQVSRSGMMRKFNVNKYNLLLNTVYNSKMSHDPVRVSGCGMDMYWHLLYSVCENVCTREEIEKWNLNTLCGRQTYL